MPLILRRTRSGWDAPKLLQAIALAITLGWCVVLIILLLQHQLFVGPDGRPLPVDFLEVWVAGKSIWGGAPAAPYDWHAHHLAQVAAIGHPFKGFLGWHYPPLFLFAAAALALLPYLPALGLWLTATFACYAPIVAKVAGRREWFIFAFAWPATLANIVSGQNGFLSGALVGGTLLFLETRPIVGGVFLGLLTYKPQLGLLFPFALAIGGHWRALASATATALIASLLLPYLAFGSEPFHAFLHFLPQTEHAVLESGTAGWEKQQTILGLAHVLKCSNGIAWALHLGVAALAAMATLWLWSDRGTSPSLKAAGLATGAIVLTPYLYMYDLPVLLIPLAFLVRERKFDRTEWIALAAMYAILLSFIWLCVPVGPIAILVLAVMIGRRFLQSREIHAPGMRLLQA